MLVLYQLQIIFGLFLSYIIDLGTHTITNSASWRVPVGLQMIWGFILLSGIFFLPESPWVVFSLSCIAPYDTHVWRSVIYE